MTPSSPWSSRTAVRGGADAAPLEYAASARASAPSIASTSRRCSTSARLRYRRSATAAIIGVMGEFLRNGKLLTLMLGHFTVDSYVGVIPVLYPLLIGRFHLSLGTVGLVSLAYGGMAAISQPLFGLLADRFGTRFTGLALAWTAITFAAVGARARQTGLGSQAVPVFALAAVIGVMMSRSWTVNAFQAFTPTWYRELGYGPEFYGPLATTLVLASAVGTVGCGSLADRYGRRSVIIATLVLTVPAILLFTMFPGPWAFASAILIGFLAASTAPLLLLMAQQLMATRAGLASGLVMGLGFVTGAIGIPINGAIGDAIGLQNSLMTHVILVIATIGIAWFLPGEKEIERHAMKPEPAT